MKPTIAARERLAAAGRGLALALVVGPFAPPAVALAAPPGEAQAPAPAQVIDHNSRSFRIPFNIDPAERSRIKEVLLTVSDDQGRTWTPISRTTPDKPALAYRAARDGEYWFAVQTMDTDGRLYPANSASIEPRMKVVVDTIPPSLTLRPNSRSGSLASVRWEIRDERLDRASFALEFQAEGAGDWRQVPIKKPAALIGEATWDAGTAGPIRVRAAVSDRAGNTKDAALSLRDGTPDNPDAARSASAPPELTEPPPLGSFASASEPAIASPRPRASGPPRSTPPAPPAMAADPGPAPSGTNPFESGTRGSRPGPAPAPTAVGGEAAPKPRLIPGPKFDLRYEVEDAGPDGPATVELWVTQNGGRTWSPRGDDPDRRSPFPVDLGGDGVFGLTLVAKSASNEGDQPPGPGDPPQYLVEVDGTPPAVQLDKVRVGTGISAGKIAIEWHATDLHLNDRPVVVSVRPDTPGSAWVPIGPAIENSGRFVWTVPATAPPKFHVRVDVADSVGNRGSDETREGSPVLVDRARPKSRIIGLDPSALNATGPAPNPFAERPTTRE